VPIQKLIKYPPFPKSIKIELTSFCNYRCAYCATNRTLRPKGTMNKEFFLRIIKEAKNIGVEEIG